jgi:hypothetical protein
MNLAIGAMLEREKKREGPISSFIKEQGKLEGKWVRW